MDQNPHSLDPPHSLLGRGRYLLTALLWPCDGGITEWLFSSWPVPVWQCPTREGQWWCPPNPPGPLVLPYLPVWVRTSRQLVIHCCAAAIDTPGDLWLLPAGGCGRLGPPTWHWPHWEHPPVLAQFWGGCLCCSRKGPHYQAIGLHKSTGRASCPVNPHAG